VAHQGYFVPLDEEIAEHEGRFEAHDVDEVGLETSEGTLERRIVQNEPCLVRIKLLFVRIKPSLSTIKPSLMRARPSLSLVKPRLVRLKPSLSTIKPALMRDNTFIERVD
jgi:hypothetical protein